MTVKTIRTLIVDDEPDILEFVEYNLRKEGHQVFTATDGKTAISKAKEIHPDLILLDVMMPEMDGIETCAQLRTLPEFKHTPIALLTARREEYSQIAGLENGADDYIHKPIRPRLLIARINTLLRRRVIAEDSDQCLQIGILKIDKEREVHVDNKKIELVKKEFDILWLLSSRPGKVFTREELFQKIWGNEVIVGTRTIDVHISKIREKLGAKVIKTVKGLGYKIVA